MLNIGNDIVEVNKIKKFISLKSQESLLRVFTQHEIDYAFNTKKKKITLQRLAVRFATKEAFFKAFGSGIFAEIEVVNDDNNKPHIKLYGQTLQQWLDKSSPKIAVSLSHTDRYALATILIEDTQL